MRIPDPNGGWKVSPDEPRLLVRRDPDETGGQYYRILPEGRIDNYDGVTIQMQRKKEGLDLNRNFPMEWRSEGEQAGAGPFPTSEPEVRAIVHFIASHPNITGGVAFHTYSGVLLRPFSTHPDDDMPAEDLWTFQKIGQQGKEITGYPAVSVYHDFRYHPKEVITGALDDWMYDHVGVYSWTVEIWSPQRQAGIEEYKFIDWYREHPFEDDLKMLAWSDEKLGGQGYVDWYPFEHPQLGPVELGGWNAPAGLPQPAAAVPGKGAGAVPALAALAPGHLAPAGAAGGQRHAAGRRRAPGAAGGAEHRLAAHLRHQESRGAQGRARRGG